jgi:hypothetical protein
VLVGIFGAGRNGSSLLMRLLDGSPGLWIYPIELNYLRSFAPRSLKSAVKRTLASCVSHLPGQAGETFEQRQRQLFRAWAADQLDELKQTYLDKLVEPIAPDGVPIERIMAHITGDAKHDLESYLDAIRLCYDQRTSAGDAAADVQVDRSLRSFPLPGPVSRHEMYSHHAPSLFQLQLAQAYGHGA